MLVQLQQPAYVWESAHYNIHVPVHIYFYILYIKCINSSSSFDNPQWMFLYKMKKKMETNILWFKMQQTLTHEYQGIKGSVSRIVNFKTEHQQIPRMQYKISLFSYYITYLQTIKAFYYHCQDSKQRKSLKEQWKRFSSWQKTNSYFLMGEIFGAMPHIL